jgi:DNA primase small subunit
MMMILFIFICFLLFSQNDERKRSIGLRTCLQEIVFAYLYPRLDANVSKQRNHLLKSPFAVHPKTGKKLYREITTSFVLHILTMEKIKKKIGRVCVPVDVKKVDEFDPFIVPTLGQLQEELNEFSSDSKPTSMKKYISFFENTLLKPMALEKKKQSQESKFCINYIKFSSYQDESY